MPTRNPSLLALLTTAFAFALPGGCVAVDDGGDEGNDGGTAADDGNDDDDDDDDDGNGGDDSGGPADDGAADGAGDGDSLNATCTDLCANTETVTPAQAECAPTVLAVEGGYDFTETSCAALSMAYANGVATSAMCVACYLDAGVVAEHCATAEASCF